MLTRANQGMPPETGAGPDGDKAQGRRTHHRDVKGHRLLVNSLGTDFDRAVAELQGLEPCDVMADDTPRWPLGRTVLLVVAFNAAAWAAIIGTIYAAI